jgi:site-specific recombinase XerD
MNDLVRETHDFPSKNPAKRQTFQTFSEWYEKHVTARKRGKVREVYILTQLRKRLGRRELASISQATAKEYLTARVEDDQVSPNTANREIDLLKSMLREAVQARLLKASPLVGMKRLRHVAPRKRVLTQAEEDRLLQALKPADRALYVVAVDTLMRLSNVLNLKRRDDKGTYLELTDSKTGPYTVPLSARARKALDSVKGRGEYFFAHRRQAKVDRDRRGGIRRMLQRACKKAKPKIPYGRAASGITFHTATRATGATRMLQAGVDARSVQAIGNWKSFEQMGAYLHTDAKRMREAVNTIGAGSTVPLTSDRTVKRAALKLRAKSA